MKKFLAIFLSVLMLVSIFTCVTVSAETQRVPEIQYCFNTAKGPMIEWNEIKDAISYNVYRRKGGEYYTKLIAENVEDLSFVDTDCENEKYYLYTIKANTQNGSSELSEGKLIQFMQAPEIENLYNHVSGVALTWKEVKGAWAYRVYRKGTKSTGWKYLGYTYNDYFIDREVNNCQSYKYTVRAYGDYSLSGFVDDDNFLQCVDTPEVIRSYNIKGGTNTYWKAVEGADHYRVYRRGAGEAWKYLADTKYTFYIDKTVDNSKYYRYTIKAVTKYEWSDFSREGGFTKYVETPKVTHLYNHQSGIAMIWNDLGEGETYFVYRKGVNDKYWSYLVTTTRDYFIDRNVTEGSTFKYAVRRVDKGHISDIYETDYIKYSEYYPSLTAEDMEELKQYTIDYIRERGYCADIELDWDTAGYGFVVGISDDLSRYGDEFKIWNKDGHTPLANAKEIMRTTINAHIYDYERVNGPNSIIGMYPLIRYQDGGWEWALGYI